MPVVPRWEWRAFGDDFGAADARTPAGSVLTPLPPAGRGATLASMMLAVDHPFMDILRTMLV
jgi:hypothetical protein